MGFVGSRLFWVLVSSSRRFPLAEAHVLYARQYLHNDSLLPPQEEGDFDNPLTIL